MPKTLGQFESPPVVETVIGVQFERLAKFSAGHVGWFLHDYLPEDWQKAAMRDVPKIEDQYERFGQERAWIRPQVLMRDVGPERVQIVRPDEERMLQLQDSRFIYNWQKREDRYPSFEKLQSEF